ncbi:ATP-binding protein [Bradyrhizobium sp. HKCCYLS2038]|uniref:ATP-binding protein n=1 Tax=unclassified Bradyrhizobium TaxID=2631580 RepID=UPI003EBE99A4
MAIDPRHRRSQLCEPEKLTFAALDGIAFAAARGRLGQVREHSERDLGPLIEMIQLARTGLLPSPVSAPWLRLNGSAPILRAATGQSEGWTSSYGSTSGFMRCDTRQTDPKRWTAFQLDAHKAALALKFPRDTVNRLISAMGEIVDNVLEHSQASTAGFVVFDSRDGVFEFVVADDGVGALASLQSNPEYAHLADEGDALQCALTDGESRFGKAAQRGTG